MIDFTLHKTKASLLGHFVECMGFGGFGALLHQLFLKLFSQDCYMTDMQPFHHQPVLTLGCSINVVVTRQLLLLSAAQSNGAALGSGTEGQQMV